MAAGWFFKNKFGGGAIGGTAGIAKHDDDIVDILSNPVSRDEWVGSVIRIAGIKAELGVDFRGLGKVFDSGIALANALMASEIKANALRFLGRVIEAAQPVKDPAIQKVISKYRPLLDTKNI